MRKRYKIPLLTILSVILLVIVFILIIGNTKILEGQVNYTLNLLLSKNFPVKLKIGDIKGNLINNLSFSNVSLDYTGQGKGYRILNIEEAKFSYDLFELLGRKWNIDLVEIYNPQITVRRSEQGGFLLPFTGKSKTTGKSGLFEFKIRDIRIIGGKLEYVSGKNQEKVQIFNLRLNLNRQKGKTEIEILQGGFSCPERKFILKSLQGKLNLTKNTLTVEDLHLNTSQSEINLKGEFSDLKKMDFSFKLDMPKFDFEDLNKISGAKLLGNLMARGTCFGNPREFKGEMFLNGKFFDKDFDNVSAKYLYSDKILNFEEIRGKVFGSLVSGDGLIDFHFKPEEYQLGANVVNLDINKIVLTSFHTDLSGKVDLSGQGFSSNELMMDINADLGWSKIDLYSFDQLQGEFLVTAKDISFLRGFSGRYKNTRFDFSGNIEYNGLMNMQAEVYFNDLIDFQNQTFLGKIRGQGKANVEVSGKTLDFDVKGNFSSDSAYVYDLFSRKWNVDFKVDNYFTRKDGKFEVGLRQGTAWGVAYDSIIGFLTMKGEKLVVIDSAYFSNQYATMRASGNFNQTLFVPSLFVDEFALNYMGNHIKLSQPLQIDIDKDLVRTGNCQFSADSGSFWISGKVEKDSLDLKAGSDGIDITPWFGLFFPQKQVGGRLTADFSVQGLQIQPQMEFNGKIDQARFDKMDLGNIYGLLKYENGLLNIDTLSLSSPDGVYDFSGSMPLDLSLKEVEQRFPQKPQDINVRLEGKKINILSYFVPDLEYLMGDFKGNLKITGSPLQPYFDGQMRIKDGTLKLEKLIDPVESLEVDMSMKGTEINFTKISGKVKHETSSSDDFSRRLWHGLFPRKPQYGQVESYGKLDVKDIKRFAYDFVFKGKNLPIRYEYADLSGVVDADLKVKGNSPPLVSGDINISELYYKEPFGSSEGQLGGIGDTVLWDLNLNISADGQVFVMNYDMNAEWKGNVVISREKGNYTLLGEMEAVRGKYSLAKSFNIEEGKMTFDNIEKIDPKLDFLISTTVYGGPRYSYGTTDTVSLSEYNDIELKVGGTLLSPEIGPVDGSPYSKEDIIQLLAIGYSPTAHDTTTTPTPIEQRLLNSLGGTIGALGSRALENWATNTIGLETFEIRPEQRGRFSLWNPEVTVGKYFANRFYVRYTFGTAQAQNELWGLEYRLSKHFLMDASRDSKDVLHLGFNLKWDF